MGSSRARRLRAVLVLTLVFAPAVAVAQDAQHDAAAAQALFDDAKQLLQQGKYAEACPKFAESQRLDPAGGTLIALALCHEGEGKTATAWAEFNDALTEARTEKRSDREAAAAEHIKGLEPKLTRARIIANDARGLEVRRDGIVVGAVQWSTPVPMDPGKHTFEARAPHKKTWSSVISIVDAGKTIDVTVPELADDVVVQAPPTQPSPLPPPHHEATPSDTTSNGSTQRLIGYVAGGVGVVGLGFGAALGISATSAWHKAQNACPGGKCATTSQVQAGKDAGTTADISTALFVIGGVALAAGAALIFTAPSGASTQSARSVQVAPWAGPRAGGVGVGGSF